MSLDEVRSCGSTQVARNAVCELEFAASGEHEDPWQEIELDFEFTDPDGQCRRVPAFWAGGRAWRVRYSSSVEGVHRYRSLVRGSESAGLEGLEGAITVTAYPGTNPLLLHGGPRVADDRRHLAHTDGKPFFWLADTWWSALTARFRWPDTFQTLADDRAEKGFSVVQLVAGLVPEFVPWSPSIASEGGQPWENFGRGRINPYFFSVPDLKIDYLVSKGIVPCIVGAWGNYAALLGRERVMQHWRYIVARYAAYPVVWCIAGEAEMVRRWEDMARTREMEDPTLITSDSDIKATLDHIDPVQPDRASPDAADPVDQISIWEDASRLVREIDPYNRIRTVHPMPPKLSSEIFSSRDSFDLDFQQAGHNGVYSVPLAMEHLHKALANGDKPVLVGECSYEGIFDSNWQEVQRFHFWSNMLSGTAGHTYGTMAISTFNSKTDPHVPLSRVSMHYWEDAIHWLGPTHVGVGKRILERFSWWHLEPSPEAVEPHAGPGSWFACYAATLPNGTVIVYQPSIGMFGLEQKPAREQERPWLRFKHLTFKGLRSDTQYHATYVNPRTGENHSSFAFDSADGDYVIENPSKDWQTPTGEDWIIVVRPEAGRIGSKDTVGRDRRSQWI